MAYNESILNSIAETFWSKVEKGSMNECWTWLGASRNGQGPTTFNINGKAESAYRIAFQLQNGIIPKSQGVRRTCNNTLCVNPNHLYIGSKYDSGGSHVSAKERRRRHAEYMRQYYLDDPKRREKKRQQDREYAKENGQKATEKTKRHYQRTREQRLKYVQEYQLKFKIKALEYLGGVCKECGFDHPSALQFHHRDPSTKLFSISTKELGSPKKYPWETVIRPELDKCDILCSNCHFLHHSTLSPERVNELKEEVLNGLISERDEKKTGKLFS